MPKSIAKKNEKYKRGIGGLLDPIIIVIVYS